MPHCWRNWSTLHGLKGSCVNHFENLTLGILEVITSWEEGGEGVPSINSKSYIFQHPERYICEVSNNKKWLCTFWVTPGYVFETIHILKMVCSFDILVQFFGCRKSVLHARKNKNLHTYLHLSVIILLVQKKHATWCCTQNGMMAMSSNILGTPGGIFLHM